MSRIHVAAKNDLQLLSLLRDEIRLQSHLFRADVKSQWDKLEQKYGELQERAGRASVAGRNSREELDLALQILARTLRAGYEDIRSALSGRP